MRTYSVWIAPGLSLLAVLSAWALARTGVDWFQPYFGAVPPPLAVTAAAGCGLLALTYLVTRHGFLVLPKVRPGWLTPWLAAAATTFGAVAILSDVFLRFPVDINVPMPGALLFYPIIALVVDMLFHVLPLAALLALFAIVSGGSGPRQFLIAALLIALVEPVFQIRAAIAGNTLGLIDAITALNVFAINIAQLAVFRRHGFVAMLALRLFYYAIWHIGWGALRLELLF